MIFQSTLWSSWLWVSHLFFDTGSRTFCFRQKKQGIFICNNSMGRRKRIFFLKSISFTESNLTYFFKNLTQYLVGAPTAFFLFPMILHAYLVTISRGSRCRSKGIFSITKNSFISNADLAVNKLIMTFPFELTHYNGRS